VPPHAPCKGGCRTQIKGTELPEHSELNISNLDERRSHQIRLCEDCSATQNNHLQKYSGGFSRNAAGLPATYYSGEETKPNFYFIGNVEEKTAYFYMP